MKSNKVELSDVLKIIREWSEILYKEGQSLADKGDYTSVESQILDGKWRVLTNIQVNLEMLGD